MGYLYIAAQGEILDGFRELVSEGKVSLMGLCAGQRAGNINSVREWPFMCLLKAIPMCNVE